MRYAAGPNKENKKYELTYFKRGYTFYEVSAEQLADNCSSFLMMMMTQREDGGPAYEHAKLIEIHIITFNK